MKIEISLTLILLVSSCAFADIFTGEINWSGQYIPHSQLGPLPEPETGIASFSFDASSQEGTLQNLLDIDEVQFTVSSTVSSWEQLTDFENQEWLIYDEELIPDSTTLLWSLSGKLCQENQFYYFLTDEIFHNSTHYSGTFSVVPEPSTLSLFVIASLLLNRTRNKRTRAWTLRGKTHFLSCQRLCPAQVTPNVVHVENK